MRQRGWRPGDEERWLRYQRAVVAQMDDVSRAQALASIKAQLEDADDGTAPMLLLALSAFDRES